MNSTDQRLPDHPATAPPSIRWPVCVAILLTVTLLVFGRIVTFDWIHWDDNVLIFRNPTYLPVTGKSILDIWTTSLDGMFNPLTRMLWALQAWLGTSTNTAGEVTLDPRWFHAGSLLLHLANTLLVFAILRRLVGHDGGALFGALLFAIHPLQVEPVAWISETKGVLLGFFALLAIWLYVLFRERMTGKGWHYALAVFCFLLASLAKSAAVTVPLVLVILDRYWLRRSWRDVAVSLGPWFLVSLAGVVAQKAIQPDTIFGFEVAVWQRPLVMLDGWLFYLRKLCFPFELAPFYDHSVVRVTNSALTWLWSGLFLLFVLALSLTRHSRIWLIGLGIAVAFTLPYSGLLLHSIQRLSTVNDRYMYLAMLGPAFCLAWYLSTHWSRNQRVSWSVVVGVLSALSFWQVGVWKDDAAFFTYAVAQNPSSATALKGLAYYEERQGHYSEAADHLRRAIEQDPDWSDLYYNLGVNLHRLEKREEAIAAYREALRLRSSLLDARKNLAIAFVEVQQPEKAIPEVDAILQIDPQYPWAMENLGVLLLQTKDFARAEAHYRQALRKSPRWSVGYANLGVALAEQNKLDEAAQAFEAALQLDPGNTSLQDNLRRLKELRRSK
jgi:tetratricopeptide (TPR) repeat protein